VSAGAGGRARALAALLLLAAALRAFVILAPGADLYEQDGLPDFEELLRGVAAQELLDGPLLPVQDYQVNHFWGGSLVASIVAVPFFALLGPNLLALRLSPLVVHLVAVALAFLILDRAAGRRAAWIGGLLLAIPPPGYTFTSSSTFSLHTETNALSLGLFLAYLVYREHRARGPSPWRAALVGLLGGFGIWFAYGLAIPVAIVLFFELSRDKRCCLRRDFAFALAGFLVGLAPWIRYQALHDLGGPVVYGGGIEEQLYLDPAFVLQKAAGLLFTHVPDAFWFRGALGLDGVLLGRLAALVLVAGALVALWTARRRVAASFAGGTPHPVALAAAFVLLYFLAYSFSGFGVGKRYRPQEYRYLMPFWPYLALLGACAVDALLGRGRVARAAAASATAALVLAFGAATVRLCDTDRWLASLDEPATTREALARFVFRRCRDDRELLARVVERLARRSADERDELLFALACGYRGRLARAEDAQRAERVRATLDFLRDAVDAPYRPYFDVSGAGAPRVYLPHQRARFWSERGGRPAPAGGAGGGE
jgi:hypothetical protein